MVQASQGHLKSESPRAQATSAGRRLPVLFTGSRVRCAPAVVPTWLAAGLLVLCGACGGEEPMPVKQEPEPGCPDCANDNLGPSVGALMPANQCDGLPCVVGSSAAVRVTFTEPIEPATVVGGTADCGGTFTVVPVGQGPGACATGTVRVDFVTAIFEPDQPLILGQTYQAFVSGLISDLAGNMMGTDLTWTFQVESAPLCGDGRVSGPELCDDGNTEDGDYCSADCLIETGSCGDLVVQPAVEACDDGGKADGDGCSKECLSEFRQLEVGVGEGASCLIDRAGLVRCWGDLEVSPDAVYRGVALAGGTYCALHDTGVTCSGASDLSVSGSFSRIAAGGDALCALDMAGAPQCHSLSGGTALSPPAGSWTDVSVGRAHACLLAADGSVACFGDDSSGQASAPAGLSLTAVAAGGEHSCGVQQDGSMVCWGANGDVGIASPPIETYTAVSAAGGHTCGLLTTGKVLCWSNSGGAALGPGADGFVQIAIADSHGCGLTADGVLDCWGEHAAASPPSGLAQR